MRIKSSDPDIETIYKRLLKGDIFFSVESSRSNKWDEPKRQKLIDTILRGWPVPPIYLIVDSYTGGIEVLDGFQRLSAIKDFIDGWIRIDGEANPRGWLEEFDGFRFSQLPEWLRNDIYSFSINLVVISDYSAGEPGEFVSRLNSRSLLTGAEKRSLSYGYVRSQIKLFVSSLEDGGVGKDFFGFSNSRMAYDDVLARVALAIEQQSIAEKITSNDLSVWYSSDKPISLSTVSAMEELVRMLCAINDFGVVPRFNKATLTSWLLFLSRAYLNNIPWFAADLVQDFMNYFEYRMDFDRQDKGFLSDSAVSDTLLEMYISRSKSKVDEVSSLIVRDAAIWIVFSQYLRITRSSRELSLPDFEDMRESLSLNIKYVGSADDASDVILSSGWGALICR